jgi:FMN-dependent NADH-azoreductase
MTTVLQLNSSLFGDTGQSTRLADEFVARLRSKQPGVRVIRRDFAIDPVPHLTEQKFKAALVPAGERTPEQAGEAAIADDLIAELDIADILVIGIPMYNFGVPSTLKAWFDHVARAGTTFRYTEKGSEGLMKNKKAYLFMTRGGKYVGTESDMQTPYIRMFLGFLGIEDVEFIFVEGLAMGEETGRKAVESANLRIKALAA